MSLDFTTELDGTDGVALTANTTDGGNSGFQILTGAWEFDTAQKASGTSSALLPLTNGTGLLTKSHAPNPVTVHYYDFFYRYSTLPSAIMIAQIKLGGSNKAQVWVNASGTVTIKNLTTSVGTTTTTTSANEWFRIMWGVDGSTQTLRLWKSAVLSDLFGAYTEQKSGTYSQGQWDSFKVGCNTVATLNLWVDKITTDDTTWPAVGVSGNAAPVADAGPDQVVTAGDTVTLDGSGSTDSDGTIASYLWQPVSGPASTLSSTTVVGPTYTAPNVIATADQVWGLLVTDNDGTQSVQDTVTITVNPGSPTPTEDFFELFNTGPNGTTITTSNTSMTGVDSGITFTSSAIGEGSFAATGTTSGATKVMTRSFTAGPIQYIDAVFQLSTLATGSGPFYIMRVRSGSTVRASIRVEDGSLGTAGTLRMRNGTTATGTATTATVTAGQPFRVAWHLDNTAGTQELRLFTGANLWGSTPDAGGTSSGTFNTGTFDQMSLGYTLAATGTWIVDSLRIDAADWPAPISSAPSPHSNLWFMASDGTLGEKTFTIL